MYFQSIINEMKRTYYIIWGGVEFKRALKIHENTKKNLGRVEKLVIVIF